MKTFRLVGMALIAILLSVGFTSCSKDDNDDSSSIVGVWEYTSNNDGSGTIAFGSDGTLIWIYDDDYDDLSGSDYTYSLKGNTLKIVWCGDDYTYGNFTMIGDAAIYEYNWYAGDEQPDDYSYENLMSLTKK